MNIPKKITFIGLGNMGNPMASNLLNAGYSLTVYDLDQSKATRLIEKGARWGNTLTESIQEADLIMTSLPGPAQVNEVYFGPEGLIEKSNGGQTFIDTSTSSSEIAAKIEQQCFEKGVRFLEAPITNAIDGAANGTLAFFIGGNENIYKDQKEVFKVLGQDLFYVGKAGNGSVTKLITNLLWFINAAAIGEGLMMGENAEIPLDTVWKAIKSSAGNSWVAEHDVPSIFEGHYDPSFSLELCCKDLGLIDEIAKKQNLTIPMGELAKSIFDRAKEKFGGHAPELSVVKLIEEQSGKLLRPERLESTSTELDTKHGDSLKQSSLMEEAFHHMPQGVAENYRYWGKDKTVFVKKAKGCHLLDENGKKFVDFRLGYGPIILGYADERVDQAVINQIQRGGTLTGFSTELDLEVVQKIKSMCPNVEKLRFANSGTEAVMGAVRTARGFTHKKRIAIVEGGFHGLYDEMMWKSDMENWDPQNSSDPSVIPFGAGIPAKTRDLVSLIPLNSYEHLDQLFKDHGDDLACILLEPIIGNCGSIAAEQQWLETLKKKCSDNGTLLILDEVKTGFRVAKGGAQELYGVQADLTTYAKAMGNGYPIAAFGGRAEVMDVIGSHENGVIHGGTYTGNLVGMSAAKATLDILDKEGFYQNLNHTGKNIQNSLSKIFSEEGLEHSFAGPDSMFGIHFMAQVPTNYRDWRVADNKLYERFAWNLIENGIMLEPDSREPWFICEAHKHMDLPWFEEVAKKSLKLALNK